MGARHIISTNRKSDRFQHDAIKSSIFTPALEAWFAVHIDTLGYFTCTCSALSIFTVPVLVTLNVHPAEFGTYGTSKIIDNIARVFVEDYNMPFNDSTSYSIHTRIVKNVKK